MRAFSRFKADQRGATAMMFAFSLVPLLGFAGAAIDYTRASDAQASYQTALDGTALALVREAGRLSDSQLQARGQAIFAGLFRNQNAVVQPITVQRTGESIRVSGTGTVRTTVMSLLQQDTMAIGASAAVSWGSKTVELALVLDNTGSMDRGDKMPELKRAAHRLLDKIEGAASTTGDKIKVSIVPFDSQVRLDKSHANAPWLRVLKPTEVRGASDRFDADETRRGAWIRTLPRAGEASDAAARQAWDGYVTDRDLRRLDPATARVTEVALNMNGAPVDTIKPVTLFLMVRNEEGSALAVVQPLSRDFSRNGPLRSTINQMKPRGCTNITLGAAWGLETLTPGAPFTEAAPFARPGDDGGVEKIMILLTDGWNTRDGFDSVCGQKEGDALLDRRTSTACETAKAKGVVLYTVKVIEGSDALLRDCATAVTDPASPYFRGAGEPKLYYPVTQAYQLSAVFETIIGQVLRTRLTH